MSHSSYEQLLEIAVQAKSPQCIIKNERTEHNTAMSCKELNCHFLHPKIGLMNLNVACKLGNLVNVHKVVVCLKSSIKYKERRDKTEIDHKRAI